MAEGAGLENRYTGNGIVGSNPTLSANLPSFTDQKQSLMVLAMARPTNRPTNEDVQDAPAKGSAKRGFKPHPSHRPQKRDVDAARLFGDSEQKQLAALLGLKDQRTSKFVCELIDLRVRTYLRTAGLNPDTSDRTIARGGDSRAQLESLAKALENAKTAYANLDEDTARKLNHRTTKALGWNGERAVRALIGERVILGFFASVARSLPETLEAINLPRGEVFGVAIENAVAAGNRNLDEPRRHARVVRNPA